MTMTQAPGWYPDPSGGPGQRWWDGYRWTERVQAQPAGGPPQKQKRVWLRVLIVLGVLFALGIGGCAALLAAGGKAINDAAVQVEQEQKLREEEIAKEVTLESCVADSLGLAQAKGNLTNGSSKRSNYTITVVFLDVAGNQVNDGYASVSNVEPGQKAVWEASAGFERHQEGMTCKVVEVSRFSDEG